MIVLTVGPASLARLMRRDEVAQDFASRQGGDPPEQAESTATGED